MVTILWKLLIEPRDGILSFTPELLGVSAWCIYRKIHPIGTIGYLMRGKFGISYMLHFRNHTYHQKNRIDSSSSSSPDEEIDNHICIETPKASDHPEKGVRCKKGRYKGYKSSYFEKISLFTTKTSYYCKTCKPFCKPECMNLLHKKLFKLKDKITFNIKKTLDERDLLFCNRS